MAGALTKICNSESRRKKKDSVNSFIKLLKATRASIRKLRWSTGPLVIRRPVEKIFESGRDGLRRVFVEVLVLELVLPQYAFQCSDGRDRNEKEQFCFEVAGPFVSEGFYVCVQPDDSEDLLPLVRR